MDDTLLEKFPNFTNRFQFFEKESIQLFPNQKLVSGFKIKSKPIDSSDPSLRSNYSLNINSDESQNPFPSDTNKFSNPILRFINEILMEEDLDSKPCMLQDCLALQAAEKSFYDVLGEDYPPPSSNQDPICSQVVSPDDNFTGSSGSSSSSSFESNWIKDLDGFEDFPIIASLLNSPGNTFPDPDLSTKTQSVGELFLHSEAYEILDLEGEPPMISEPASEVVSQVEREISPNGSREKRRYKRDGGDYEGREHKLSAVYDEGSELPDMFDKVLLCQHQRSESISCGGQESSLQNNKLLQLNLPTKGSGNGKTRRSKKDADQGSGMVDLWTLLTQCAQAVSSYDRRTANDLLKRIRQNSSPFGDGTQRLAHYFANGLETRLAAGTPFSSPLLIGHGTTTAEFLKAYQLYIASCPFQRMSNFVANRTILQLAENATSLHIIDFGILYGFQWPCLIQRLSERQGGPPKLRITGIDLPQPGFRPAERVEETGRRLENYCRRFNVPFEWNVIAQKWETIRLEDLNIDRTEVTVVNCLHRLKNLPDETVMVNSPRDAVLNLIRRIKPDMFIHGVVNGTYNAPFFLTRFREALFHFSAFFDMFEANVAREDPHRLLFEGELLGREAMNVIACEGAERVERPETYKQWQVRNKRVGLKQVPLDREILNGVKEMVRMDYHKDFVVNEAGKWMLQGWKGRIINAISCWKLA